MMKINKKITLINFSNTNRSKSQIKYLVYHYVGAVSTAKNNADFFYNAYRGASAHYFVDEKEIWQVVEDNDVSWAVGNDTYKHKECRNTNSISIEMCCKKDKNGKWYIEEETIKKSIELGKELVKKYNIDRSHVLRHYDVTGKKCPEPMVREPKQWNNLLDELFDKTSSSTNNNTNNTTTKPTESTNVSGYTVEVTTDVLNVRKQPGTSDSITTQVKKGEVYTIVAEANAEGMTWGKLKSGAGWISLSFVKKLNSSVNKPATNTNKKMKVNAKDGLNVRSTPGGTKVGALTHGTEVTVVEEKDGWSKIGDKKWVSSQYLVASTSSNSSENLTSVKVKDKVKVKSSAKRYVTGETIPDWVKGRTYTVSQIAKNKILLKEIMSWVYLADLTK